jgi:integrase
MPRITKRLVESLEPEQRDVFLWDTELRGFGVRVYPTGQRRYVLQWKRDGRTRRYVIGIHGPVTAEQARAEATRLLGRIARGEDPAEERDARRADLTVGEMLDLYLAEGSGHLRDSTRTIYRSAFDRHVKPLLGGRKLASLRPADVAKLQEDVANGRTARVIEGEARKHGRVAVRGGRGIAARARQYLGAALSWAVRRGLMPQSPAAGLPKLKTRKLDRYLSADEFRAMGEALAAMEAGGANPRFVAAVRLLALTGCRRNEVARLRWAEVNLEAGVLRLAETKTGARLVPLAAEARALLAGMPRVEGSPWVFPAARGEGPIAGLPKFFAGLCRRAGLAGVTLHTLRHSLASTAVASGASLYLVGKALGHASAATTQRYAHVALDPVAQVVAGAAGVIARQLRAGEARAGTAPGCAAVTAEADDTVEGGRS